jgi:hypothetical protein
VLALLLPLLALDCLLNVLVGESWRHTLSSTAWRKREHKWWGWTHKAINALFFWQANHCRGAWRQETIHGSVWAAFVWMWRQ